MTPLLQLYGRYNPAGHCWLTTVRGEGAPAQACIAIVRAERVSAPEGDRTYMLLGGASRSGPVMALIEFGGTHGLRVVAHSPPLHDDAPPDFRGVSLQKLGDAQWGWVADMGGRGRGDRASDYVIWLPRADRIVPVARLPHTRHEGGSDMTVAYSIDWSDLGAAYYPLDLTITGSKDRHPVSAEAVAIFDLQRYAYRLPPALP